MPHFGTYKSWALTWDSELNIRALQTWRLDFINHSESFSFYSNCLTDKTFFFSLSLSLFLPRSLSHRLAASLLEQGWRSPVAQVGWKRVFFKANWQQHVWNEWQSSPAADQRGLSLSISSFRWESGPLTRAQLGQSVSRWLVFASSHHAQEIPTVGHQEHNNNDLSLREERSCWHKSVWGEKRKSFQVKGKLWRLGEGTHLGPTDTGA